MVPETVHEVALFVPVHDIFPEMRGTPRELMQLLTMLSRDDTLIQCARINTIVSGFGDLDTVPRQQQALSMLCTPAQIAMIDDFAKRHKSSGPPVVFFRGQMLELMRWVALHCKNLPNDGTTYSDPAFRERFAKAALVAGGLWSTRTYRDTLSSPGSVAEMRLRALGALRKGVEEANLAPHIGIAIGRGIKLFTEYLPRHEPDFATMFARKAGISVREYLSCACAVMTRTLQNSPDGPLFSRQAIVAETTVKERFQAFFNLTSQSPVDLGRSFALSAASGARSLRERPILTRSDGLSIVLDPTYFIEIVSVGALFHATRKEGQATAQRLFSAFGDAFEQYATDILARMYPHRPGLVDRVMRNQKGRDAKGREFEVDASLLNVSQAVFFEMKAVFLREEHVTDSDPDVLLSAIRAKYGAGNKPKQRDKGVAQLARSIGAVMRGEWLGDHGLFSDVNVLYPVLVAHDMRLDAPGLGHFLENDFRRLLGPIPIGKHVRPLTVMTVQDLENLEASVNSFSFVDLLNDYSREFPDRMRSLHNFIAFSSYGTKILPSPSLIAASTEIITVLLQELFPRE